MAASMKACIAEYAAAPTPPSPLTPLPQIPSPSLPLPSPPQPLPALSSHLLLPSTDHSDDILEADLPPQKRQAERPMFREIGYGIIDTWDELVDAIQEIAPTTLKGVNQRVIELATTTQLIVALGHIHTLKAREPARIDDPEDANRVATALAAYEANRGSTNDDDSHNSRSGRRTERAARECTYNDFLKCQPLNFKGTKGVVGLNQWFEKMESVFHISNCTVTCQIKFATCTLLGNNLTWWNYHVKTIGHDDAYGMPWKTLKKMMTDKYCPRELALMYSRLYPKVSDEVEKYVDGLPDMIQGSVMASKPKTIQDTIEFTTELMDQNICTFADPQAENKRKLDDNSRNNQNQQQPFKKQNVAMAYTVRPGKKKVYGGSKPLFPTCNYYHDGQIRGLSYALSVEFKDITIKIARSERTRIRKIWLGMVERQQGLMQWVMQGKTQTPMLLWGCTLNFLNHPFNIDLMLIEIGSFDVIIGMDSLAKYHVVIVCDEKIVRIPFGNKILIVRGDESNNGHESRLNIISCTKT
nr:hypothetical protein [Tanacetum cinerariifolium]